MAGKRGKVFVSGDLTVGIKYNDRGYYVAKVCSKSDKVCEKVVVNPPRHLVRAVDSARAFHDAAHAAISFSKLNDGASGNPKGSGWSLRKPRRSRRR